MTSPGPMGAGEEPIAIVLTQIRPVISWSSPATTSPSRTWTTAVTVVLASPRLEGLPRLADVPARESTHGHHAGEHAVVLDDRHQVEGVPRHRQPDVPNGLAAVSGRKVLAHDIAHPQHHMRQEVRRRRSTALEHPARLSVQIAQPDRHVFVARIEPPLQLGVPDGRADRVGIGNAMSCDVDHRHGSSDPMPTPAQRYAGQRGDQMLAVGSATPVTEALRGGWGVSNTQGVFQARLARRRLVHVTYTEEPPNDDPP